MTKNDSDEFTLYDLRVEVVQGAKKFICAHRVGNAFEVHGENILFAPDTPFSLYALAALIPLLPAKQRQTDSNDWMTTDEHIACPDSHCGGLFKITRIGTRVFKHSEVSGEVRK